MSFKRKIESQFKHLLFAISTISLPEWVVGAKSRMILSGMFLFFTVAYILNISNLAATGYKINNLEKQVESTQEEVQKLEIQLADASSVQSIQKRISNSGMVAVESINHIKYKGGEMAINK